MLPTMRTVVVLASCTALGLSGLSAAATAAASAKPQTAASATLNCRAGATFARQQFPTEPKITNRYLPLRPGTDSTLTGTVIGDDGLSHRHVIRSTVSSVTKVLAGVRTVVVYERDYQDGQLQESELAFQAQDRTGTLWNVGEYPEEYEDGQLVGASSTWITGIAGARAGINMPAHPALDQPAYLQGVARSVDFRDCAQTVVLHRPVRWSGHLGTALVSDEWAPLDPEGGHQLKYYVAGVGVVRVGAVGGTNPEVLALTRRVVLSQAALRAIDEQVLRQDRRGYRVSRQVYAHTAKAEPPRTCA
jgi:hypothetical protein